MTIALMVNDDEFVGDHGRYLAEIMRSEGLTPLEVVPRDRLLSYDLDACSAVVVSRGHYTRAERAALAAHVRSGGGMVLVRPSMAVAKEFGLDARCQIVDRSYLRPEPGHPVSVGLPSEWLETRQPADAYGPAHGTIATLGTAVGVHTDSPAIFEEHVGDGRIVVFSYDVGKSVARIRQGDPDRIGGRTFGQAGPQSRAQDLLIGGVDLDCIHLPQADIHASLLANAVTHVARRSVPRWWFHPQPHQRSVVVIDSDDDYSSAEAFDDMVESLDSLDAKATFYLMMGPSRDTTATPERVAAWQDRGHSFGIHHNFYDASCAGQDEPEVFRDVIRADLAKLEAGWGIRPEVCRNHCVGWSGYVDIPRLWATTGVIMDMNMCSYAEGWHGYLNGSARPLRFVDVDGTVIDCFQQATRLWDDGTVIQRLTESAATESARAIELLDDSIERWYTPLTVLAHPVSFHDYSKDYHMAVWRAARERGVELWSAQDWARFTLARDHAEVQDINETRESWAGTVLGASPRGYLTLMLPLRGRRPIAARVDNDEAAVAEITVLGVDYVQVAIPMESSVESHTVRIEFADADADGPVR